MTEFNFIKGDIARSNDSRSSALLAEFAAALRQRPGEWAEYPRTLSRSAMYSLSSRIRRQDYYAPKAFRGEFETTIADVGDGSKKLYVRFVGGAA